MLRQMFVQLLKILVEIELQFLLDKTQVSQSNTKLLNIFLTENWMLLI